MKVKQALKRTCGEKLAKFISINFNQDVAHTAIIKHFNNNGKDVKHIPPSEFHIVKQLLNHLSENSPVVVKAPELSATELLKNVGYDLIRVKSQAEAKKFKKYFRNNELLCKFDSTSTYTQTHVFFIVKHGAEKIKPRSNPKRQDDYSTSVMSTKISHDGRNVLQLTSRYNHAVSGCDNTYNSSLDNIVGGLSEAFNFEFGYKISRKSSMFEFTDFVEISDTFVHYHKEIDGIKIGNNTLVTDKIINFSHDSHYTYDYYIINLKTKQIVWDKFFDITDAFVEHFNSIVKQIEFVKDIDVVDDFGSDSTCFIEK